MFSGIQDSLVRVGTIYRWDPATQRVADARHISAYNPLYIGRNRKLCEFIFDDPRVSSQHLRIYTIIYDSENPEDIAPLVYAQDLSLNGTFWNGLPINKQNGGTVLLSNGDILRLSPGSYLEFRSEYGEKLLPAVQRKEANNFARKFLITNRLLGQGTFGQVRMAINMQSESQVACKIVDLRSVKRAVEKKGSRGKLQGTSLLELQKREVNILQKLCHPNIIRVEEVIQTETSLYIFEDLVAGGDLFTYVQSMGGNITDFDAASIIRQILIALSYLHDSNVAHRDLKPENILMMFHGDGRRVMLADFGCAQFVPSEVKRMSSVVGTWDYTAPEVYKNSVTRGYTKSVDLWSVGCITVVLLMGAPPFSFSPSGQVASNEPGNMDAIFKQPSWIEASALAQNFVLALLVLDEKRRLSAKEALDHYWFTNPKYRWRLNRDYEKAIRGWRSPFVSAVDDPSYDSMGIVEKKSSAGKENLTSNFDSYIGYRYGSGVSKNALWQTKQILSSEKEGPTSTSSKKRDTCFGPQRLVPLRTLGGRKSSLRKCTAHKKHGHLQSTAACPQTTLATMNRNIRQHFSPHAWNIQSKRSALDSLDKLNRCKIDRSVRSVQGEAFRAKQREPPGKGFLQNTNEKKDISVTTSFPSGKSRNRRNNSASESSGLQEGGEVYEEVENKLTGERQRFLYGEKRLF